MTTAARQQLARQLRLLRFLRGWSQEQLADASGLHRTTISLIERSACSISLDHLEQLAAAFGIALPELLAAADPSDLHSVRSTPIKPTQR